MQRDAEFFIGRQQFRIDLIKAFWAVFHALWLGIIGDTLKVDFRVLDVRPIGTRHLAPYLERTQTPLEQPLRFILFRRNKANGVFGQAWRQRVGFYVSDESSLVVAGNSSVNLFL